MDSPITYAKYSVLPDIPNRCISHLMDHNELVWKLLKYNDPDAWKRANLTRDEKASMIYIGQEDATTSRVFMDQGQPDVWTHEDTIIRISPYSISPDSRYLGTISVMFEVYSHYKINHLSNYQTRVDVICQQFLEVFNGIEVSGMGPLFFNKLGSLDNRMTIAGQIPFKGKWMILSTKSG